MSIKKLASQTLLYGLSTILGRFINYLLTPLLTALGSAQFGEYTTVYANITFFNIIFTYGMETAYFRFSKDHEQKSVFNTACTSLLLTTIPLMVTMLLLKKQLSEFWSVSKHPEYVIYFAIIVGFDCLALIPFAKLRQQERPLRFAMVKFMGILVTVGLTIFFLNICPWMIKNGNGTWISTWYQPEYGIGYAFIANMISSAVTLLFLTKQFAGIQLKLDTKLWKEMMVYALPLLIVGFGGMINETIDRTMLPKLLEGTEEFRNSQNGIYGANYKLAILIVLFIQTFRMGAEPFFIKQSGGKDAPQMYARIMNLFVIACCLCYLIVVCYLDVWKYFMRADKHPEYLTGLVVVPILLVGKIFLGIYYNMSIWYKVTNKTMIGAYITLGGALITLVINLVFIKRFGFITCAWASLACYGFMMVVSYFAGQKHYPIPYNIKKIGFYIAITIITFLATKTITAPMETVVPRLAVGTLAILLFLVSVLFVEKDEFKTIPVVRRLYGR